jgi:hypothetical protein
VPVSLADARNLQQLFRLTNERRHWLGPRLDCLGSALVRANTETVVTVDLHEIGGFVEDVRYGFVIQVRLTRNEILTRAANEVVLR